MLQRRARLQRFVVLAVLVLGSGPVVAQGMFDNIPPAEPYAGGGQGTPGSWGAPQSGGTPGWETPQPYGRMPNPSQPAAPPVQRGSLNLNEFMVGTWQGTINDSGISWNTFVSFGPDGIFQQRMLATSGAMQIYMRGRYEIQSQGPVSFIQFNLLDWQPRQLCQPSAGCVPLNLPPQSSVQFRPMDHDTFQADTGVFRRVQG